MKNKLIALCSVFIWQYASLNTCQAQNRQEETSLKVTPVVTRALIDSIWQSLTRNYIFPDTALKMSVYLDQEYKKGAYAAVLDPQDLARRLEQDLQKAHHDGHFHLRFAPGFARQLSDTAHVAERHRIDDSLELINMREKNFLVTTVKILPGNIGYVQFNGFTGFLREARPTFTGAFRLVANTKALIIDLRNNGGGSLPMVSQVASYFFPTNMHWNDMIYRNRKGEFWTDPAEADSLTLSMPICILTSRRTFSAAEDFSYGMQSLRRAIIVGDTTGGGAHPTRPFSIGLGFVADIPYARSLNPYTHTDWEGTGVIPDIPIAADSALETAEKAILTGQVQNATTNAVTAQTAKSDSLPKLSVPEMILVDSGTFVMGCTGGHTEDWYGRVEDCQTNENPNHIVTLSSYKIGKFEVSQAEWKSVMGVNPSQHKDCDQCPVEKVSWNDVQEFLQKLNEQTGRHYQLPTEAQWEYAARGGKFSRGYLFAGSNEMPSVAWWGQKNILTYPAGLKQPNELGIYDMSGNVWEWCSNWFADYNMIAQTNPQGPPSGAAKVIRGGSGRHEDHLPRVYTRTHVSPDECSNGIGFRLVLVP